ncbi:hypothetical protein ACFY78_10400 [Streptomyces olindensis]|uniref:hypothetical protein n=1 Tax=Streptomyces olindensis TaxID=358823 RepID=UPI00367D9A6E
MARAFTGNVLGPDLVQRLTDEREADVVQHQRDDHDRQDHAAGDGDQELAGREDHDARREEAAW